MPSVLTRLQAFGLGNSQVGEHLDCRANTVRCTVQSQHHWLWTTRSHTLRHLGWTLSSVAGWAVAAKNA